MMLNSPYGPESLGDRLGVIMGSRAWPARCGIAGRGHRSAVIIGPTIQLDASDHVFSQKKAGSGNFRRIAGQGGAYHG